MVLWHYIIKVIKYWKKVFRLVYGVVMVALNHNSYHILYMLKVNSTKMYRVYLGEKKCDNKIDLNLVKNI